MLALLLLGSVACRGKQTPQKPTPPPVLCLPGSTEIPILMPLEWSTVGDFVVLPFMQGNALADWIEKMRIYAADAKACLDALAEGAEP